MKKQDSIPRRAFGDKVKNPSLPASVPIVGVGCSSFANNFVQSICDLDPDVSCNQETAHLLPAQHEKVKGWVDTLKHAVDRGINLLDTAPWYGHGSSEVVIGFTLKEMNVDRSQLIINTKIGRYDSEPSRQFDFSYDATIHSVKRSIERMGCEYIDVLQLHDPEFSPSIDLLLEETIPAMLECKKRGWAKALGLTGYPLETQYQILRRVGDIDNNGEALFDQTLTYGHFNLHDQSLFSKPVENRRCFVEYCRSKSLAIMAAAPLSMGLLTPNPPPFWHPAPNALKQATRDAAKIAERNDVDLPTLAILFALAHESIGCTLLGMGCKRDVDCALAVIERYSAIEETQIGISGVEDNGNNIRNQIRSKLSSVLSTSEKKVLDEILDERNGPFAELWKSGEYAWNGIDEADKFWTKVNGGKEEAETRMRKRSIVE